MFSLSLSINHLRSAYCGNMMMIKFASSVNRLEEKNDPIVRVLVLFVDVIRIEM